MDKMLLGNKAKQGQFVGNKGRSLYTIFINGRLAILKNLK